MNFLNPNWNITPRRWQELAHKAIHEYFLFGKNSGIIRAIMGAGKSVLIAELCATAITDWQHPIVVSTPSVLLVRQLHETIKARVRGAKTIGCYYTETKNANTDIIIACMPSLGEVSNRLRERDRKCALWIADEAHLTQSATMLTSFASLSPDNSIGFTATPFRARTDESITLFTDLIYDYGPGEALRDGVVVPWRIVSWEDESIAIDDACIQMIRDAEGPGIVNASSISDAEAFCARLNDAGIKSECVHSRMTQNAIAEKIELLKAGKIRSIVHVALLVEGADYPWLRWICLRRDVDSRVRFLQEIGRCLRSYPGKSEAVFYDPNDLFGAHKISYKAALGSEPDPEEEVEALAKLAPAARAAALENLPETTALIGYEFELRRLVVACDADGMCPDRSIVKRTDRVKASSSLQRRVIVNMASKCSRFIPDAWKSLFNLLFKNANRLQFGPSSDFCCILNAIASCKKFPPINSEGTISAEKQSISEAVIGNDIAVLNHNPKWRQLELEF